MNLDTPRTDANAFSATCEKPAHGDYELEVVYADFARKLERQIAALRKELQHVVNVQESCAHDMTEEDWIRLRLLLAATE